MRILPIAIFAAAVAIMLMARSVLAALVVLTDGMLVAAVLASAAGWGAWPSAWLGFHRHTAGQQLCVAVALGLGVLGAVVLGLGCAGWLNQPAAWLVVAAGGALGLHYLYSAQRVRAQDAATRRNGRAEPQCVTRTGPILDTITLLALAVPASIALFGATLAPGALWLGEARGYDVLEYHLQCPKEYFQAGRITFLPHNVYASFPQQVEILYLLLMHLRDDPYAAAVPAQLLHLALAACFVAALAAWTAPGPPRRVVILLAGSTPWLAYLGVLAYVECGLLYFAAVAVCVLKDALPSSALPRVNQRMMFAAGLCAGLAGGCKYIALVLVVLGLVVAWLAAARGPVVPRLRRALVFSLGAMLAFSPWAVRNAGFTSNPVYPFAYSVFGGTAWSAPQADRWARGHHLREQDASLRGRLGIAARELIGGSSDSGPHFQFAKYGPGLILLGIVGAVFARSRWAWLLAIWCGLILAAWAGLTHMPARFAVPLIVPLALLAAAGTSASRVAAHAIFGGALFASLVCSLQLWGLLDRQTAFWRSQENVRLADLVDATDLFRASQPLNDLPEDAVVQLVGDAAVFYVEREIRYAVVFGSDPWLEFASAGRSAEACLAWLAERGVTHVSFATSEIARLRATYGFAKVVTPEWLVALERAGLRPLARDGAPPGFRLYEVPASDAGGGRRGESPD